MGLESQAVAHPFSKNLISFMLYFLLHCILLLLQMCKIIDGFPPEASKLTKVFSAASLYYNFTGTEKCFNIENATDAHGLSGWEWQVK